MGVLLPGSNRKRPHNYPKQRKPPQTKCEDCKLTVPAKGCERIEPMNPRSKVLCQLCAYARRASKTIRSR